MEVQTSKVKRKPTTVKKSLTYKSNLLLKKISEKVNGVKDGINPKKYVKDDELLAFAISKITDSDISQLWQSRLSVEELIRVDHKKYNEKSRDKISYDDYLEMLRLGFKQKNNIEYDNNHIESEDNSIKKMAN